MQTRLGHSNHKKSNFLKTSDFYKALNSSNFRYHWSHWLFDVFSVTENNGVRYQMHKKIKCQGKKWVIARGAVLFSTIF